MTLLEAYEDFILDCSTRRLKEKTIDNYRCFIKPFVVYIGTDTNTHDLTLRHVKLYMSYLSDRAISDNTYHTYIRHIKAFINWGDNEDYWEIPISKIRIEKDEPRCVKTYTSDEILYLIKSIHAESEWITYRNQAMFALMYDSGLRRGELVELKWSHILFDKKMLIVRGKGGKERYTSLGDATTSYLKKYCLLCPYEINDSAFIGRRGKLITLSTIKDMMRKLQKVSGVNVYCHLLRHNYATNFCIDQYEATGNMDVYGLSALLGHSKTSTTEIYIHHAKSQIAAQKSVSHLDKVLAM